MANCRTICPYRKICAETMLPDYAGGENGEHPQWECPVAFKIEDLLMDAWEPEDEDEVPFDDEDYDGPEEDELP